MKDFVYDPLRIDLPSAWLGHIPFGYWIGKNLTPKIFVELGTHYGHSFFNICNGIYSNSKDCECYGIDTWEGDVQAGIYGEEVYESVRKFNQDKFLGKPSLLKMTFEKALNNFENGSIDLLHIDGLHTYDAVKKDLEDWLPKMSGNGVILLHDICVKKNDFGVWKLWDEIKNNYGGCFEFHHSSGLGVLRLDELKCPELDVLIKTKVEMGESHRSFFRSKGLLLMKEYENICLNTHISGLNQFISEQKAFFDKMLLDHKESSDVMVCLAKEKEEKRYKSFLQNSEYVKDLHEQIEKTEKDTNEIRTFNKILLKCLENEACNTPCMVWTRIQNFFFRIPIFENVFLIPVLVALSIKYKSIRLMRDYFIIKRNNVFDKAWYLQRNTDVLVHGVDPLLHWISVGWKEGRNPNCVFDTSWYLNTYNDVKKSGVNPLSHYLKRGCAEGRNPNSKFNTISYREDLNGSLSSGIHPLSHYLQRVSESPALSEAQMTESKPDGPSVVLVSGEPNTPGNQYRIIQICEAFSFLGNGTKIIPLDRISSHEDAFSDAQIVFLWRVSCSLDVHHIINLARRSNAKIIYDVDDLMFDPALAKSSVIDGIRSQGFSEQQISQLFLEHQMTMSLCDYFTCPTESLATQMRRFCKPTFVIPNGFSATYLHTSRMSRLELAKISEDDLIRIGYASGSRTHQKDFQIVASACARILKKYSQTRLVIFHRVFSNGEVSATLDLHEFPEFEGCENQIETRSFVDFEQMPYEISRFDINLAPLEVRNPFCESKSELKFFESALVKVPTIASPTLPYRTSIRHGKTGYLADSETEWYNCIEDLILNPEKRKKIADNAHMEVLWKFGHDTKCEIIRNLQLQVLHRYPEGALSFQSHLINSQANSGVPEVPDFKVIYDFRKPMIADVSIVVPVYNYENYILEALESVKDQTYPNIELIVVDDRSTDDSASVVLKWMQENENYFSRVTLLQNNQNSLLGLARNAGFAFAESDYILPLDADNKLLPTCIEKCLYPLMNSTASMAYPIIQHFGEDESCIGNIAWTPADFISGNHVDAMALIKKAAWARVGGYRNMHGWEDFDLWCKFLERGMWGVHVPEVLALYRVHEVSMLRTTTMHSDYHSKLQEEFKHHHPWVNLI